MLRAGKYREVGMWGVIFARKIRFSRKPEANGSLDRCKYIRTRSDKVAVFQTATQLLRAVDGSQTVVLHQISRPPAS